MPVIFPYIPRTITVHLGAPDQAAENVTVSFPDYVKNVASSEIYPTWEPAAIRANVLAIVSFALNRVYTEFYPSRGYDFQITSTTAYDQKFIRGRDIFQPISQVVDEFFDDYIRRVGFVEPLSAKFCNGTTTKCDGLSQWGSQELAQAGYNFMDILRRYYGDDIELVLDAPVRDLEHSYPGTPLRRGDFGPQVLTAQVMLNRVAQNYPAIPKIYPTIGLFTREMEETVKEFQRVFSLTPDGVIGKGTWYRLVYLYVGVTGLAELVSQGQTMYRLRFQFPGTMRLGDRGDGVTAVQDMLSLLAEFDDALSPVAADGVFGPETQRAVQAYQRWAGLADDGVVGPATWNAMFQRFIREEDALEEEMARLGQYPGYALRLGQTDRKGRG